jgi:hypothetical protein
MKQGFFLALAGAVRLLRLALWVGLRLFMAGKKSAGRSACATGGRHRQFGKGLLKDGDRKTGRESMEKCRRC